MVRFFEPTNNPFEVLAEDLVRKVNEPQLIPVRRSRVNVLFNFNLIYYILYTKTIVQKILIFALLPDFPHLLQLT